MDNSGFGRHRESNSVWAPTVQPKPSVFIKRVISHSRSTLQFVHLLNFRWIDLPEATMGMSRLKSLGKNNYRFYGL